MGATGGADRMMLFRIYLGKEQNPSMGLVVPCTPEMLAAADARVERQFDGYTTIDAKGVWRGKKEGVLIYEFISLNLASGIIEDLARDLRDICNQACVLVTKTEVDSEFI